MNSNTLPKQPAQPSVDEPNSITKRPSENDTDSTLPNPAGKPSSNLRQEGFPDGSVMWDGPEPSGEGARSAVPCIPQTKAISSAKAVTEPAEASPMQVSGAEFATADRQKSRAYVLISDEGLAKATRMLDSTPTRNVSVSSVNDRKPDSANDPKFEVDSESVHEKMDANDSLTLHPGIRKWEAYQSLRSLGFMIRRPPMTRIFSRLKHCLPGAFINFRSWHRRGDLRKIQPQIGGCTEFCVNGP